uniref:7SK snRNA methylphosphate capping enzyme-like n=1 Tax=Doryrhamphus excisus TaxID=161450 RepID=UPI0025AE0B40|nr:7SK snRNA methylphosphate capping enzyme-like [Doryrhamphus excisus]XP_057943975.1 7SK snRNA methylphosphate capping enzyme-like [Doryrhamphus excisus]
MSVDEDTVKTGSPEVTTASSLQLSECSGSCTGVSVLVEGATVATPDLAAACPVPGTAVSPKHSSTVDALNHSNSAGLRPKGNEPGINRRNSFHHVKQHQQMRVAKRRNTSNFNFKHPTSGKRRRRANSESDSVLPTNFLLGGNIFDPLNLNSLQDEEVNRALNAETPKSSPLPLKSRDPVEILIPRDITDPLNLNSSISDSSFLVSPLKSGGRRRHRNRHHGGSISATQLSLSESVKNEVKPGESESFSGAITSASNTEVSKASDRVSCGEGDSHEHSADHSSIIKDEVASVPIEDSTSSVSAGANQHTGRRKRRRNSGKMDPPVTQSTPVAKSTFGEQNNKPGRHKNTFHTPRSGCKSAPVSRQHQQRHNQARDQQKKFQFGNYNKYYGYRNPSASEDPRIHVFRPEWFEGKRVLDLGCNSGNITLYIAKMLRPASILGLDIDSGLVHAARKNIRHFLSELQTQEARRATQDKNDTKQEDSIASESEKMITERKENGTPLTEATNDSCGLDQAKIHSQDGRAEEMEQESCDKSGSCSFPLSLQISRGPIAAPPLTETSTTHPGEFPSNVSFIQANYVLQNDNLLVTQRPEYDVILCLSVTKWVHLNWGDTGLKRFFKRVYKHLHPGGIFILEPQPWQSYVKRKKLTDTINRNFHSIRLKPDQFSSYLTNEVGFTSCEFLGKPKSSTKGFQRPIYLFHK